MKCYTTLLITCLLSVSNLSCAEQGESELTVNGITESTLLLDSGDVFMKGKAADANYFL